MDKKCSPKGQGGVQGAGLGQESSTSSFSSSVSIDFGKMKLPLAASQLFPSSEETLVLGALELVIW